jgi:putative N6-adenine-specific DNA methylase
MKAPTFPFFTPAVPGLETEIQRELWTLGAHPYLEDGGFFWKGTWRDFYRAQLLLRSAGRVLVRIKEFEALSFADLERETADLPWRRFLTPGRAFKLKVSCTKSKLYHDDAVAERVAKAAEAAGGTWFPGAEDGDAQLFIVRAFRDKFTISADGSGEHLHKRGYRQQTSKAPLRETVAAALLYASGWIPASEEGSGRGAATRYKTPESDLTDPFCGSGTIAIEAALAARRIPPGLANRGLAPREYAFQRWPSFDADEWAKTVDSLKSKVLERAPMTIRGSDRDEGAVAAARGNAERAGVAGDITWERRAVSDAVLPERGWVVTNPPFGVRVSEGTELRDLYAVFGRLTSWPGLRAAWLCADESFTRAAGGNWTKLRTFPNGGLDLAMVARGSA